MKARLVAGFYALSDPRMAAVVVTVLFTVLAVVGALMPAYVPAGLLADPVSGGGGNG